LEGGQSDKLLENDLNGLDREKRGTKNEGREINKTTEGLGRRSLDN